MRSKLQQVFMGKTMYDVISWLLSKQCPTASRKRANGKGAGRSHQDLCPLHSPLSFNYISTNYSKYSLCMRVICRSSGLPVCREALGAMTTFGCTRSVSVLYPDGHVKLFRVRSPWPQMWPGCYLKGLQFIKQCDRVLPKGGEKHKLYHMANKTLWFTKCLRSAALWGPLP